MKTTIFLILLIITPITTYCQNLVVEGSPVLLPRLTTSERDQTNGQEGMIIFNKTEKKFQGYVGGGDQIQSFPPIPAMSYNLANYLLVFLPDQDGVLTSIELYTDMGGNIGSLQIISAAPCEEYSVHTTSNEVTSSIGWNTYTFTPPLIVTSASVYYVSLNSGVVTASLSQSDNPLLQALFWNGLAVCTQQSDEFAVKINQQGSWINLH